MFDRAGRDAIGRLGSGSRVRTKAGGALRIEPLEGRAMMTASLGPIPSVTVEANAGYQVPLNGTANGNTDPQTYTVSTDNPTGGVTASVSTGNFLTINVSHTSSGANDPAFSGPMTFEVFSELTPTAVSKIEALATGTATGLASGVSIGSDYYAGKLFHRITALSTGDLGSVISQGGSIDGRGSGQVYAAGYANETNAQLVFNGVGQLALANTGAASSNDAQFFITSGADRFLDGNYTIFGQLVSGQPILNELAAVATNDGSTPVIKPVINSVTVSNTNPNGVVHINAASSTAGTQTNVTVKATDTVDGSTTTRTFPVLTVTSQTGSEPTPTMPRLNTVTTPQTVSVGQDATIQLSAYNPSAQALSYTVQGGLTGGAFTAVQNATASVSSTGLVTVTPTPGYIGPISLVVGVRGTTNFAGGTAALTSPANYSTQAVTLNVAQPVSTGAVRFLIDGNANNASAGSLIVTPLPRTDGGTNTINITQSGGNVMVSVNGTVDATEPSVSNVDRIIVYGSKANDTISVDPSLTMEVSLDGGRGGKNVLKAGGGATIEEGWYGTSNTLQQGTLNNAQFGRSGHVTFVKGAGTSDVIFAGQPGKTTVHGSRIRRFPTPPSGTFYAFSGSKLVKVKDTFTSHHTDIIQTSAAATGTTTTTKGSVTTTVKASKVAASATTKH